MSAYICNPETFVALAAYAAGRHHRGYPGSATDRIPPAYLRAFNGPDLSHYSSQERAEFFAEVLYEENIRSVLTRYPNDTLESAPGPLEKPKRIEIFDRDVTSPPVTDPIAILKLCDGLEYQSSETDDWRETLAFALLGAIRKAAIRELSGYDDAEWTL